MDGVQEGTFPMTTGISVPVGNRLFEVSRRMGELKRNGGTMNPAYQNSRFEFIYEGEGFRSQAYDDQTGRTVRPGKPLANDQSLRTIGYGFNLDDPTAKAVFEKAVPGKSFEDVKSGRASITEAEARKLYDTKADESEAMVERFFGKDVTRGLPPNVRIALVSMAYNSRVQNGRPTLFGPSLKRHVQAGNWPEVAREILYRTHSPSLFKTNPRVAQGLLNRRRKEAALILGANSPDLGAALDEARQTYRLT
jgi:GH24 family phage-related lysozyme (muramidase)